jgi:glycosyltransferase involved in cell wall biosynthesis
VLAFAGTLPHFPRPVYEAGLMKKAVVVFDMQGITENVEDGVTGLVVTQRTGKALGQAIRRLFHTPERLAAMGEAGFRKAAALPETFESASSVLVICKEIGNHVIPDEMM